MPPNTQQWPHPPKTNHLAAVVSRVLRHQTKAARQGLFGAMPVPWWSGAFFGDLPAEKPVELL